MLQPEARVGGPDALFAEGEDFYGVRRRSEDFNNFRRFKVLPEVPHVVKANNHSDTWAGRWVESLVAISF